MRVAVVQPNNPKLAESVLRIASELRVMGADVHVISCMTLQRFDVLILPDTGGLDCTSAAFYPHQKYPPHFPGQDQAIAFFVKYKLDWYIKKSIPILGIGTGGLIVWSEVLKNKLDYNINRGTVEVYVTSTAVSDLLEHPEDNPDWSFFVGIHAGIPDEVDPESLWEILRRLMRAGGIEPTKATVPVPTPPRPLKLQAANENVPPPP